MSAPGEMLIEPRPEGGGGARVLEGDARSRAPCQWCKGLKT